jgi:hypothetical protein
MSKRCWNGKGYYGGNSILGGGGGVSKVSELLQVCLPRGALLKPLIFETILHLMNFIFSLFLFLFFVYWRAQWKR